MEYRDSGARALRMNWKEVDQKLKRWTTCPVEADYLPLVGHTRRLQREHYHHLHQDDIEQVLQTPLSPEVHYLPSVD